jgi:hypothetical protein
MEQMKQHKRNKGGRPKKRVKQDQLLSVKCSLLERKAIEVKAEMANLSVSAYLRKMGLTGKIDRREKVLPKEILQLTATLNHLAANLNQIAKKRNGFDELDVVERAMLSVQSKTLQKLALEIKDYLK